MSVSLEPIELEFLLTTRDFFRALVLVNIRKLWFLLLIPLTGFADLYLKVTNPDTTGRLCDDRDPSPCLQFYSRRWTILVSSIAWEETDFLGASAVLLHRGGYRYHCLGHHGPSRLVRS